MIVITIQNVDDVAEHDPYIEKIERHFNVGLLCPDDCCGLLEHPDRAFGLVESPTLGPVLSEALNFENDQVDHLVTVLGLSEEVVKHLSDPHDMQNHPQP